MKKRGLVIGLLIMLALVTSGFTYAFWANGANGNSLGATGTVTIGEGNVAETAVVVGNETGAGPLVPANRLAQSPGGSVSFVVLEFVVQWNSAVTGQATGVEGALAALVSAKAIDGNSSFAGLVGTEVRIGAGFDANGDAEGTENTDIIVDGATVSVFVKVTLTEPTTQADYLAIATKNITFTVTFTTTPDA